MKQMYEIVSGERTKRWCGALLETDKWSVYHANYLICLRLAVRNLPRARFQLRI